MSSSCTVRRLLRNIGLESEHLSGSSEDSVIVFVRGGAEARQICQWDKSEASSHWGARGAPRGAGYIGTSGPARTEGKCGACWPKREAWTLWISWRTRWGSFYEMIVFSIKSEKMWTGPLFWTGRRGLTGHKGDAGSNVQGPTGVKGLPGTFHLIIFFCTRTPPLLSVHVCSNLWRKFCRTSGWVQARTPRHQRRWW